MNKILLSLLLLATTTLIDAMHITTLTTIISNNDIFMHNISPLLLRSRDSLKRVNQQCYKLITSQDELNNQYSTAHQKKDIAGMKLWGLQGGMLPYTELAYAINDKKTTLAKWLITHNRITLNDALSISTNANNTTTIVWLLDTYNPLLQIILNCLNEAQKLNNLEAIITLENYTKEHNNFYCEQYPDFPSSKGLNTIQFYNTPRVHMRDIWYP